MAFGSCYAHTALIKWNKVQPESDGQWVSINTISAQIRLAPVLKTIFSSMCQIILVASLTLKVPYHILVASLTLMALF